MTVINRYPLPATALLGLVAGLVARYGFGASVLADAVLLATLVVGGLPVVLRTVRGMLHGRFATDIVAMLAIVGAAATREYFAGCVIVLMQTGGEALEDLAVRRASASLQALISRAPRIAHVASERGDANALHDAPPQAGNGAFRDVAVAEVRVGDRVLVRQGEIIPVDGLILSGLAAIDESALTGEPLPRSVKVGGEVMSGSICTDGTLELRALRVSRDSQYEQIVRLVAAAQEDKAPIGRLADRYAVVFTPATLLMCGVAHLLTQSPEAVVAVLVVATPCPLILATPVAVISGINRAARFGIIVMGGAAIEQIGEARVLIFDKTGTLTQGTPMVDRVVPLDGVSGEQMLRLAAGLEQYSLHPMARALVAAATGRGYSLRPAGGVSEMAGQGISGRVDGHMVDVGSVAYAAGRGLATAGALREARSAANAHDDATAVLGIDGQAAGLIVYADPVRPGTLGLLQRLRELGVRNTVMLTGDDEATAHAVAEETGISQIHAQLLPAGKVEIVKALADQYGCVAMVGDGINDAPALAAATIGIALGARGAAVAAEAADLVITTDDIGRVADAVAVGQRTLSIAKQSIFIGLGVSGAMMIAAAFGGIVPAAGALLQEGLDVAVILNALRAR